MTIEMSDLSYLSYVGKTGEATTRSWKSQDSLLYAVAVGAGGGDPARELEFTTENSHVAQRVLPSFVCVAATAPLPDGFSVDMTKMLHAEMSFELFRELEPSGSVVSVAKIDSVYDKGTGALVSFSTEVRDSSTNELVARLGSGMFLRGEGNFGGERGPKDDWQLPARTPDNTVVYKTLREQALIYRLTGDRNPLHSDPAFARSAGFDAPILHGMCTYGFTARGLLHAVAGGDPARFGSMYGRFSKSVTPGETLTIQVWLTEGGAQFRTLDSDGDVVIDRGRVMLR
ncbi:MULTISPECIES: MaoC family dehydratase [unclassified Arthrobacter]|uniref:MaoC family dehydratase n=1 Tax=unclassified Arthrobacter TaxID=235627 RepID=UPI0009A5BD56|nr:MULTISPECIES: MaoC family dehydratase [unclassified Arthrobacter]SLK15281.1 Acyl dehydratase [Arthrobacter sp. P2b]